MNSKSFEDCKRTLKDIESFFFQHPISLDFFFFFFPLAISFHEFLVLFAPS
jgi:hypothetical protein